MFWRCSEHLQTGNETNVVIAAVVLVFVVSQSFEVSGIAIVSDDMTVCRFRDGVKL